MIFHSCVCLPEGMVYKPNYTVLVITYVKFGHIITPIITCLVVYQLLIIIPLVIYHEIIIKYVSYL